jgi:hypothetical protein
MHYPQLEDLTGGRGTLEHYKNNEFELADWHLDSVLEDVLMVQYVDVNEDGTLLKKGSIYIPLNVTQHSWRVGKVILSGPSCKQVKKDDHVVFFNDKGLKVTELNGLKNIVFLNESRVFGICSKKE